MRSPPRAGALLLPLALACSTAMEEIPDADGSASRRDDRHVARGAASPAATGEPVSIAFSGQVGGEAFGCGRTYPRLGASHSSYQPVDFRLYVHDLRLLDANFREVPIALANAAPWQDGEVALVDFTDGEGLCAADTDGRREVVEGLAATPGATGGLRLRIGVPPHRNALDPRDAAPPLDLPALYLGPLRGRRYLSVEGRVDEALGHAVHLACSGGVVDEGSPGCAPDNIVDVELIPFDPARDVVVVDLAALLAGSHLTRPGGTPPAPPQDGGPPPTGGCRSEHDNPACAPIFERLGLPFAGRDAAGSQRFVRRF